MINDLIAEVCTELTLLSAFASHIEHTDMERLKKDEAMLLSGLSVLSAHAQKIKSHGSGKTTEYLEGSVAPLPSSRLNEDIKVSEPSAEEAHKWVFDVLESLATYTRAKDLGSLTASLERICNRNCNQLKTTASNEPAVNSNGVGNIVAFAPVRCSKLGGQHVP